jgi:hypothetical protein
MYLNNNIDQIHQLRIQRVNILTLKFELFDLNQTTIIFFFISRLYLNTLIFVYLKGQSKIDKEKIV